MAEEATKEPGINLDNLQVEKAVSALWQYVAKTNDSSSALLDTAKLVNLQLSFQKIPDDDFRVYDVCLDHSLLQKNSDVCLFVPDLDRNDRDYSETVRHYSNLLAEHNVTGITEVFPLKKVTTEYKPYSAKRNLADMFDFYLVDGRIERILGPHLGKNFARKKLIPICVDLTAPNLKEEIDRALRTSLCPVTSTGCCCMMRVANTAMTQKQVVANIFTSVNTLAASLPGGGANIKTMYIKTNESPAIPIYVSSTSPNDVILPEKPEEPPLDEPEDVTTVEGGKVVVTPEGDVIVIPDGEKFDPTCIKPIKHGRMKRINTEIKGEPEEPEKKQQKIQDEAISDTEEEKPKAKIKSKVSDKKAKKTNKGKVSTKKEKTDSKVKTPKVDKLLQSINKKKQIKDEESLIKAKTPKSAAKNLKTMQFNQKKKGKKSMMKKLK